jgi:hypothetical protein
MPSKLNWPIQANQTKQACPSGTDMVNDASSIDPMEVVQLALGIWKQF